MRSLELYLRAYKREKLLEVWTRNKTDKKFQLLVTYPICQSSGILGPKRKEGDLQVPEGFYQINHFNPLSNFYLSLGIDYPNKSDRVFADKNHPGGAIYIHGSCVTVGCIPITDDKIKELYILAVEAINSGQKSIHITICPAKMTGINFTQLKKLKNFSQSTLDLWSDLKNDYECFEREKTPPVIEFLANGRHLIREQI
jgi:murein L,D-transpeptidase YafK